MILMGELPAELEERVTAEATRRALTTQELLRIVLNESSENADGQTTRSALPWYVSSTPPNWEQTVRDWTARNQHSGI